MTAEQRIPWAHRRKQHASRVESVGQRSVAFAGRHFGSTKPAPCTASRCHYCDPRPGNYLCLDFAPQIVHHHRKEVASSTPHQTSPSTPTTANTPLIYIRPWLPTHCEPLSPSLANRNRLLPAHLPYLIRHRSAASSKPPAENILPLL